MELVLLGLIIVVLIGTWILYNSIVAAKNDVENNSSTIQTVLQNRYDLIPNLIEIVKQYASHEEGIVDKVATMRSQLINRTEIDQTTAQQETHLTSALKTVFALSENYPDLKANTTFIRLQDQRSEMEDRLQAARRGYNYAVTNLRNKQEMFPYNLVAKMITIKPYVLFEGSQESQKSPSAKDLFSK